MTDNDPLTDGPLTAALARDDAVWAREHLERDVVAWLTTVAPDGRVQSSLISFLHDGADLFFYSQPDTPKLRNIAHSPLVSFHLQSDPYGDHSLIIEGTAVIDATIPPLDAHERYRAKYGEPHAHWAWTSPRPRATSASRSGSNRRAFASADPPHRDGHEPFGPP